MSIVTAIVKENFTVISADTRITFHKEFKVEEFDDDSKLSYSKFGWIGGVGFSEFVKFFQVLTKKIIEKNEFDNMNIMKSIYNSAYDKLSEKYKDTKIDINAKIIYSFIYLNNNGFDIHTELIQKGAYCQKIGENILVSLLPDNSQEVCKIRDKYKNIIEQSTSVKEIIFNNACYIEEIANITDTVGKICDFGIMKKIDNNSIELSTIREDVNVIKRAYKNGTLEKYIKIINTVTK